MRGKVFVVHPSVNLLSHLAREVIARKPEEEILIFPNKRAVAFTRFYLAKMRKASILPKMYAFEDWIRQEYVSGNGKSKRLISEFDQAWLAYKAYRRLCEEKGDNHPSWDRFFLWGLRLVELFREFDLELKEPKDFHSSVIPEEHPAYGIMSRLRELYSIFNRLLEEENATTYGKMARWVAERGEFGEGVYRIVGFYALTQAESKIFKRLFDNGAFVYWHADVSELPVFYDRWKREWGLSDRDIEVVGESEEPEIRFFEAYSLHSELELLRGELFALGDVSQPDRVAVVLMDQRNLLPLLYTLPNTEVNVTMGYPLYLTSLFALLGIIKEMVLLERKGLFPLDKVLSLLKLPLVMDREAEEKVLKKGAFLVEGALFQEAYSRFVEPFERITTPLELAEALKKMISYLLREGKLGELERGFVVRLVEDVLPVLKRGLFSRAPMEKASLFGILEHMLRRLSIPFEGEPLSRLQVMGLLETRLLSFDRVFIVDANEGLLPAAEEVNPLAPQALKKTMGLPDRIREEKVVQYHFERLVKSSKRVDIFWQTQITPEKDGFEGKKIKSRFVERLIWEMEKKRRVIIEKLSDSERDNVWIKKRLFISPEVLNPGKYIAKGGSRERVESLLKAKGITQSMLNMYMECPLKFYHRYVLGLDEYKLPREVAANEVGEAVHEALKEYYQRFDGGRVEKTRLSSSNIMKEFEEKLSSKPFYQNLSEQRLYLLMASARERIERFVRNQPETTRVLYLEKGIECFFKGYLLYGIVDRMDERRGVVWVLDYKTGNFNDRVKFTKILGELDVSSLELDWDSLKHLYKTLKDIQLPLYTFIAYKSGEFFNSSFNAAYVDLYKTGKELPYADDKNLNGLNEWICRKFEDVLEFLVKHILWSEYWYPAVDDEVCSKCGYKRVCRFA